MKHHTLLTSLAAGSIGSWAITILLFNGMGVSESDELLIPLLGLTTFIAVILTLFSVPIAIKSLSERDPKSDNFTRSPIAKVLSLLLVILIIVSTYAAIKSVWYSPMQSTFGDRFIYENISTITGLGGITLLFILSAVQKDLYLVTNKQKAVLDERQLHERRKVFEKSYKVGSLFILFAAWMLGGLLHNIPAIMANHFNSVPGHLNWIGINIAVTLFALPLIIAAWQKK